MKFYKGIVEHNPSEGAWGDCYRTAIGCLINTPPDEIPHWWDKCQDDDSEDDTARVQAMQQWLGVRGYYLARFYFHGLGKSPDSFMEIMGADNPDVYYLLSGSSENGNHVVICLNNKIVHDPTPGDPGIIGPLTETQHYCIEILIPVNQTLHAKTNGAEIT